MSLVRRSVFRTARLLQLTRLGRRVRPGAVVLCYHNVISAPHAVADPALHLPLPRFIEQIDWLAAAFDIVPLDEIADRLARGASVRGLAAITFDDAYVGTVRHAVPWLSDRGIPSAVFVPTRYPDSGDTFWWDDPASAAAVADSHLRDRWLAEFAGDAARIRAETAAPRLGTLPEDCRPAAWDAIVALASRGVTIGAHSVTHRTLPALDDAALAEECRASRDAVAEQLGEVPRWFAYPYGRTDARVASAVREARFRGALALDGRDVTATSSPFHWGRVNVPAGIDADAFDAWISGFAHWRAS